jgi:hypothetical protein
MTPMALQVVFHFAMHYELFSMQKWKFTTEIRRLQLCGQGCWLKQGYLKHLHKVKAQGLANACQGHYT